MTVNFYTILVGPAGEPVSVFNLDAPQLRGWAGEPARARLINNGALGVRNRGQSSSLHTNRFLQKLANIRVNFFMLVMLETDLEKYQLLVWELLAVASW